MGDRLRAHECQVNARHGFIGARGLSPPTCRFNQQDTRAGSFVRSRRQDGQFIYTLFVPALLFRD